MNFLGVVSHAIGAATYLFLGVLLLTAWRGRLQGGLLVAVVCISCIWCAAVALHSATGTPSRSILWVLELCRDLSWLLFGFKILRYAASDLGPRTWHQLVEWGAYGLCTTLIIVHLFAQQASAGGLLAQFASYVVPGHLAVAIIGWTLVEQIYRNTRHEHRWAVKFLCLGMGAAFAYDFVIYAGAVLVGRVDGELWDARGLVQAMIVPLIAVSAARNPQWSLEIFVSRQVVFYTATVLGTGGYLVMMAALGYYIREVGGSWGGIAQVAFLCATLLLLSLLFFSGSLRARAKVFLSKHFFKNKYDYREEWLRFTQALSSQDDSGNVHENIIRATCAIVGSPGGTLWLRNSQGVMEVASCWNRGYPEVTKLRGESSLISFLESSRWVIFLDEYRSEPSNYEGLQLPECLSEDKNNWVIVPLPQGHSLLGFIVLQRSETHTSLNWEDSDLFRTVGEQSASYLALYETTQALTESRQFEAFHRLSSYVVHDLKNIVAQLSLISDNSKRHIDNPEFVRDALETVDNATGKMKRMLMQLRQDPESDTNSRLVNVDTLLRRVLQSRAVDKPIPSLEASGKGLVVRADPDKLSSVFEHLIQNAQEATPDNGVVTVRTCCTDGTVLVEIEDSGCGMDENFIRNRLYKPFDTTKGNAGMGIGVYEARDFVISNGGEVDVTSHVGKGTVFRIWLPSDFDGAGHDDDKSMLMGNAH